MKSLNTQLLIALTMTFSFFSAFAEGTGSVESTLSSQQSPITVIPVLGATAMDLTGLKENGSIPNNGTSAKSGSMIGVLGGYQLGLWDSTLEAGLVYMETGTQVDVFLAAYETTISYLTLPVSLRVPMFTWSSTLFHVKGGIIPSFLMSAKMEGTGFASGAGSVDIKDQLSSFDLITQVGFGGLYKIDERFQVHGDMAYLRGLTEVSKEGSGYNQGLSLSVALAISI